MIFFEKHKPVEPERADNLAVSHMIHRRESTFKKKGPSNETVCLSTRAALKRSALVRSFIYTRAQSP